MALRDIAQANAFKCTVVSLVPFDIREPKPGLNPGEFFIKASDGIIPSVLVVSEGTYGIYLDGDRGTLRARTSSAEVSRSIFEDYINSQLAVDDECRPALFAVPGALTVKEVMERHKEELAEALAAQNKWFSKLVKMGDDSWNRYHQHGAITDLMRHAAKSLNLIEEKDWMKVENKVVPQELKCPACQSTLVAATQAICQVCHCVVNKEAYDKLSFAGAPSSLKASLAGANK